MTRSLILRCSSCGRYTLHAACPDCGAAAKNPLPAKFSPEDPYGAYRRRLRRLGPAPRGR